MKKKIMIVDDDPDVLISLRNVFEHEGFEVYAVTDGEACLEELKNGFKGVILLDVMMPIMDGWKTIENIAKENLYKGNIISMLTIKNEFDYLNNKYKKYIKDFINKPFEPLKLVEIVNNYWNEIEKNTK